MSYLERLSCQSLPHLSQWALIRSLQTCWFNITSHSPGQLQACWVSVLLGGCRPIGKGNVQSSRLLGCLYLEIMVNLLKVNISLSHQPSIRITILPKLVSPHRWRVKGCFPTTKLTLPPGIELEQLEELRLFNLPYSWGSTDWADIAIVRALW